MNTTINISLPKSMYQDVKKIVGERGYASVSELVCDALRNIIFEGPKLTENKFTDEVENQILRRAKKQTATDLEWDGKTDFTEFVLKHIPGNANKD